MPWSTTGNYETEFDPTTNLVLRTLAKIGVTDEEIEADQNFIVDLFMTIGNDWNTDDALFMAAMDCAFIGLLYHRHMPFKDEDDQTKLVEHPFEANDYLSTMNVVMNSLHKQVGIEQKRIDECMEEGAQRAMNASRRPDAFDSESLTLHRHLICLTIIGTLVHRLLPTSDKPPTEQ